MKKAPHCGAFSFIGYDFLYKLCFPCFGKQVYRHCLAAHIVRHRKDAIMEKLLNAYLLKETGDIEVEL